MKTDLFWRSINDGMYYKIVILNNPNAKIIGFEVGEKVHNGYLSSIQKETVGTRHSVSADRFKQYHNLNLLLIDDIMYAIAHRIRLDLEKQLQMTKDLIMLLQARPELYLLHLDILSKDKYFQGIIENRYTIN